MAQKEEFSKDLNLVRQQVVSKAIEEGNFEMNCFKLNDVLELVKQVNSDLTEQGISDILTALDTQLQQICDSFI